MLRIARGRVPVQGAEAVIEGSAEEMRLKLVRLMLPGSLGAPTVVTGTATVRPNAGMLGENCDLQLDRVAFTDLATLWPDGGGRPGRQAVGDREHHRRHRGGSSPAPASGGGGRRPVGRGGDGAFRLGGRA